MPCRPRRAERLDPYPRHPDARWSARILPGVCQRLAGAEDVMRGEETQLLGLGTLWPGFDGAVQMPGTHSKWVQLAGRRVSASPPP